MQRATDREAGQRAAATQALFRAVNERVQYLNEAFNFLLPLGDWVCECPQVECVERLPLSLEEYAEVRADLQRFIVSPDESHVYHDIHEVVAQTERFWTVQLRGELTP